MARRRKPVVPPLRLVPIAAICASGNSPKSSEQQGRLVGRLGIEPIARFRSHLTRYTFRRSWRRRTVTRQIPQTIAIVAPIVPPQFLSRFCLQVRKRWAVMADRAVRNSSMPFAQGRDHSYESAALKRLSIRAHAAHTTVYLERGDYVWL